MKRGEKAGEERDVSRDQDAPGIHNRGLHLLLDVVVST